MLYRILHEGIPVLEFECDQSAFAEFAEHLDTELRQDNVQRWTPEQALAWFLSKQHWQPLSGFDGIRAIVESRDAVLRPNPEGGHLARESALRHADALYKSLELRDQRGALVPTEYIDIRTFRDPPRLLAFIDCDPVHSTVPALKSDLIRADGDAEQPPRPN